MDEILVKSELQLVNYVYTRNYKVRKIDFVLKISYDLYDCPDILALIFLHKTDFSLKIFNLQICRVR